jgi:hypothetical protein
MWFSKTMAAFTFLKLFIHGLKRMKELQHLSWPPQSQYLSTIEHQSVLETKVRIRIPPPTPLKILENVLREE